MRGKSKKRRDDKVKREDMKEKLGRNKGSDDWV